MNTRTATKVFLTGSLVMLIGGATATAAWGGPVREDRVPSAVGLARGHVIVRDDLSPAASGSISSVFEGLGQVQEFGAEARRELHSVVAPSAVAPFTADARRELHSRATATPSAEMQGTRLSEYAEAMRSSSTTSADMQGQRLAAQAEAMRESGSGGVGTDDDLSPLGSGR
ncbi:hypothetical protein [Agromyces sp. SYSU T00266]|uniref:hypothetical protein n=1 Tax=Agromyces zhanjiangensis TaxID=3158562 RepID=UPI003398EA3E